MLLWPVISEQISHVALVLIGNSFALSDNMQQYIHLAFENDVPKLEITTDLSRQKKNRSLIFCLGQKFP